MPVALQATPGSRQSTQLSREQIMSVTSRVLREEGYDATTIRRIAGRLDCAVGSIYRYFKDKRNLLIAVAEAALQPAVDHVEAGGSLEDSARIYHQLAAKDAALYQLTFWLAAVSDDGEGAPSRQGGAESQRTPVVTLAAEGRAPTAPPCRDGAPQYGAPLPAIARTLIEGWTRRMGDEALASQCWAVLHGCITLRLPLDQTLALVRSQMRHSAPRPQTSRAGSASNATNASLSPVILNAQPPRIARLVQPTPAVQHEEPAATEEEARVQANEDVVLL
ncbi:MAG: TetR/AcrR family transcriptional regulator [Phycisphaeraceae bacterium]